MKHDALLADPVSRERIIDAAVAFAVAEMEVRQLRRRSRCTEMSKGEPEIGDAGVAPCCQDERLTKDEYCEGCLARLALRSARRVRNNAKARMLRRINAPQLAGESA